MVEGTVPPEVLLREKKCALALQDIEDFMKSTRKYALRDLCEHLKSLEDYARHSKKDVQSRQYEPIDYVFHTLEESIGKLVGESHRIYDSVNSLKSSCHLFREENNLIRK
ncbi:hypothetical protein ABFB09_00910 [Dehalogenimonas sp. THU2]|uniref:hypothetical protein n=1 Tax=Dehalogenimonas sp. THU2 TaxID=3151121 RepID=UPI0032188C84